MMCQVSESDKKGRVYKAFPQWGNPLIDKKNLKITVRKVILGNVSAGIITTL